VSTKDQRPGNENDDSSAILDVTAEAAPEEGPPPVTKDTTQPLSHSDKMRKWISFALVGILAGTVAGGFYGWVRGHDLGTWTSFTTPVFTLAGVALTFYFTRERDS